MILAPASASSALIALKNSPEPSPLVTWGVAAAIAVGIGSQYLPRRLPLQVMARFSRLPIPAQAVVLSLALLVIHAMGPEGVAPFIYFQF